MTKILLKILIATLTAYPIGNRSSDHTAETVSIKCQSSNSLYTDVDSFFFSWKKSACARARRAREQVRASAEREKEK